MKLSSTQVKQTLSQFQAEILPDDHPAAAQLNNLFGNHTFFLDNRGLKVLEPTGAPEAEAQSGEVVSLADWSDATLTSLRPHEPEMTGVVVVLAASMHGGNCFSRGCAGSPPSNRPSSRRMPDP